MRVSMKLPNIRKIEKTFKEHGVLFAYLFGSQAQRQAVKGSDFDIAVYLPRSFSLKKRLKVRLTLIPLLEKLFAPSPVDVIVLNDTHSATLRYEIVTTGEIFYMKDKGAYPDFVLRSVKEYEEMEPFFREYNKMYIDQALL